MHLRHLFFIAPILTACGAATDTDAPDDAALPSSADTSRWSLSFADPTDAPGEPSSSTVPSPPEAGLVPMVRRPPVCTPQTSPVNSAAPDVAVGLIRVHLPGYCLDGEARCTSLSAKFGPAWPGTPFAQSATFQCVVSPTRTMRVEVAYAASGRPTSGSLHYSDTRAGLELTSALGAFPTLARAPYTCAQGLAAALRTVGPVTQATRNGAPLDSSTAEIGLMARLQDDGR